MEHDYWTTGYSLKKRKSVRVNRLSFLCFFWLYGILFVILPQNLRRYMSSIAA